MKDLIEKYKEFKNNRRLVGVSKLLFWIVFFAIIMIIYYIPTSNKSKVSYNSNEDIDQPVQTAKDKYAFDYKIGDVEYKGYYYENNIELIGDACSFYITDSRILSDKENCILPDYKYLNIDDLDELRINSELESTTSYKDGKEEYKYTNEDNTKVVYVKNNDDTINVNIVFEDKEITIYYYDFDKVELSFDSKKYLYELKEVENEY